MASRLRNAGLFPAAQATRYLGKLYARPARFQRNFTVLALESSADDTCAAIVTSEKKILSNVVFKQHADHQEFGGIHPTVAIAAHQREMARVVRRALSEAGLTVHQIDGIAFTRGPGIGGCLSVGSNAAKTLAAALGKPLIGVHHMHAHALTPQLTCEAPPAFPFLTLLISGGHTLVLVAFSPTSFRLLATTVDESIGNAFDKVSRMLKIPWSRTSTGKLIGPGAALEQFALSPHISIPVDSLPKFTMPLRSKLAFSFSGLISHVQRHLATAPEDLTEEARVGVARAFQRAAVGQLEEKVKLGLEWCERRDVKVSSVVVSGGVASNLFLRERLSECLRSFNPEQPLPLLLPPPHLCTDNAAMIAWASMDRFLRQDYDDYSVELRSKWDIEELASGSEGN
ncbi:hypothetical protein BOTBODRAFT_116291 [Botryobasidium botryosum FD-172 SS1]|uniref:N(6)-L-threonylcarbamoyladenine synthase n=1 Tax=Botryobasidium botryosum (strain FD-172 SS1) TaxID=930990 RepID=A0A067M2V7_BOTB1|nr:hypothetical protein BOTBODRAFT_116291 [Botryobasidium botryosum FD-172 SS1]